MKFKLLSKNTMIIIEEMLKNQTLLKLVDNNGSDPLSSPDIINTGKLVMNKIFPAPFTGIVPKDRETNLRVYFPDMTIENRVILDTVVMFQVVTHRELWNITVDEKGEKVKVLRPLEILHEIVDTFEDKSIKTLGIIHFDRAIYRHIDKDYCLYDLCGKMMTI